jgi:hypothetical protein
MRIARNFSNSHATAGLFIPTQIYDTELLRKVKRHSELKAYHEREVLEELPVGFIWATF